MVKKAKPAGVHKNALSHGAYAQDFVLPWENEQDFVDLHKGLRIELEPDGPSEKRRCSVLPAFTGRNGDLQSGDSLLTAVIPTPPLSPKQARTVGAALGNILNSSRAEWRP
jgi:hypothetical protein